jgi:hypothetical protein
VKKFAYTVIQNNWQKWEKWQNRKFIWNNFLTLWMTQQDMTFLVIVSYPIKTYGVLFYILHEVEQIST